MSRVFISRSLKAKRDPLEDAVHEIGLRLRGEYKLSRRAIALLLLSRDEDTHAIVKKLENRKDYANICRIIETVEKGYELPLSYVIGLKRQSQANMIAESVTRMSPKEQSAFSRILDYITIWPGTGIPILFLVLYYGLYRFVGGFGARTAVNFLELRVFHDFIGPLATAFADKYISSEIVRELIVGEYGIITLGLRYAVAMVLPIVGTFFIVFSVLEDTGYLPRLSLLADSALKLVGLTGRAVIPLTLGLGCDTMATLITRTLESHRERVITTFLLALAVPCSGQLGVIMGMLSQRPLALVIWVVSVLIIFLLSGFVAKRVIPGDEAVFVMEIPPLRMPVFSNVVTKTILRLKWYFAEIIPIFIGTSVLIWVGRLTGILDMLISCLATPVRVLGLPGETAFVFLFGFLRRDYGAAGLYDLFRLGKLSGVQLVVACVVLTLFVPCVAQFAIMWKERGGLTACVIAGSTVAIAFVSGLILNASLAWLGLML